MGQKVKISARGIYGNSKMIRHFSDSQLPSNPKETQKFKLPCDRERWTTAIVCNPRRKVIVGVGTVAFLTPSWFRCLVDDAGCLHRHRIARVARDLQDHFEYSGPGRIAFDRSGQASVNETQV